MQGNGSISLAGGTATFGPASSLTISFAETSGGMNFDEILFPTGLLDVTGAVSLNGSLRLSFVDL